MLLGCLAASTVAAQSPPEVTPPETAPGAQSSAAPAAPATPAASAASAEPAPSAVPNSPTAVSPAPPRPAAESAGPASTESALPRRRPRPDYQGRERPSSIGQGLLWVPRVVLYPVYLASEYVVRRPLGWLVSTAEREHWPTLILNFFTFGDRQGGILPTWLIDYGLRPSVGVYAFWNDFLVEHNDLRLRAAYGGNDTWLLRLADRFPLGPGTFSLAGVYDERPDNVFYGVGPNPGGTRSRYYRSQAKANIEYDLPLLRNSHARFSLGLRQLDLNGRRHCCEDPSVDERVQAGSIALPAGMDQVYAIGDQSVELVLDSRWPRSPPGLELASDYVVPPGTGVRLALRADLSELGSQSLAAGPALADAWLHYGASLGGYWDVTGEQRSIGLTAIVDLVDPLGSGQVPLTDLVSLGGERPLQGFLPYRFIDRSAAALRLEYRWPVAVWLDGELLYETGSVFGEGLSGFDLGDFRNSFGFGLSAVGATDHRFQLLVALGTSSFEAGSEIDSFRFVLGTTAGF